MEALKNLNHVSQRFRIFNAKNGGHFQLWMENTKPVTAYHCEVSPVIYE